jgi:hypothetical protein
LTLLWMAIQKRVSKLMQAEKSHGAAVRLLAM